MTNHYSFVGGDQGPWRVISLASISGESLPTARSVRIARGLSPQTSVGDAWALRGFTSNVRYAERSEIDQLRAHQEALGRPAASCAALIPIRKSARWWARSQDERRAIFEAQSHHTEIGLAYLPAIARQLHHCRDIGESFDFLTWFEFAPEHAASFDRLVAQLRATPEWEYVEREVEICLVRQN